MVIGVAARISLACALLAACTTSQVAPTPSAGTGSLVPCDAAAAPQPRLDAPTAAARLGPAAPAGHRFCLSLDISRNPGWQQTLRVGVLSDRPSDPLRDRTLLVYHPGGPGSTVVPILFGDPPPVDLARYAVLTWDGTTSATGPGACGMDTVAFITSRTPADVEAGAKKTAVECLGGFGGANDIGAWAAAEELEVIRSALGVDRLDLLTHSYGTAIAEAYLWTYPEHVRRAVLDAPIGLQVPWADRLAAVAPVLRDGADTLARSCATAACAAVLRDVPGDRSYEAIRSAVLAGRPAVGSGTVELTPVMFDQATELALRSAENWDGYAGAIDEALTGDATSLWRIAERLFADLDRQVFYRSLCADIDAPRLPAQYAVPNHDVLFAYASELAPCHAFPRGVVRAEGRDRDPAPDVLIVASRQDILAPPAVVASAPFLQAIGSLCSTDVPGHTNAGDPDVQTSIKTFLESGDAKAVAASC